MQSVVSDGLVNQKQIKLINKHCCTSWVIDKIFC